MTRFDFTRRDFLKAAGIWAGAGILQPVWSLIGAGKTIEAEREYHSAIRLNPTGVSALANLGVLLARTNRSDEAIKTFAAVLRLAPDHPLAGMQNVVLTPHIGGATYDTEANHSRLIADDLARLFSGERPLHCINPEVLR